MNIINKIFNIIMLSATLLGCYASSLPVIPSPFDNIIFQNNITNGLVDSDREVYYNLGEGINWLPLDIWMSLDRPQEKIGLYDELFFDHPERLGMVPNFINGQLPIGVAVTHTDGFVDSAGLACPSCHTQFITYKGKGFLIDGGQGQLAIDRVVKEMIFSMLWTVTNPIEFDKFYDRYQKRLHIKQNNKLKLDNEFEQFKQRDCFSKLVRDIDSYNLNSSILKNNINEVNKTLAISTKYSVSERKFPDAFPKSSELNSKIKVYFYLIRRISFFLDQTKYASNPQGDIIADGGLGRSSPWNSTKNLFASELYKQPKNNWLKLSQSPVNTPFIWDYDREKWIFRSGVTNSIVGRNVAQGIALLTDFDWQTFDTTISLTNLNKLTTIAKKITPPEYPEKIFGPIDREKSIKGKALFKSLCLQCHNPYNYLGNASGSISLNYADVGTEKLYIKAQLESFYDKNLFSDVLKPVVDRVINKKAKIEGLDPLTLDPGRMPSVWINPAMYSYEAKPLYGVWATAPYLHNGSVLNIRELLKPSKDRLKHFYVGSYEYDPVNLGFVNEKKYYSSEINIGCSTCVGNDNSGHEFGTSLSDSEKDQLIEFLKLYNKDTIF